MVPVFIPPPPAGLWGVERAKAFERAIEQHGLIMQKKVHPHIPEVRAGVSFRPPAPVIQAIPIFKPVVADQIHERLKEDPPKKLPSVEPKPVTPTLPDVPIPLGVIGLGVIIAVIAIAAFLILRR